MEEIYNQMHYDGTQISKFLNRTFLFDKSGRSITQTVIDGSSNLTNGGLMLSGEVAHAFMIGGAYCLFSKNKNLRTVGGITWLLISIAYIAGRQNSKSKRY